MTYPNKYETDHDYVAGKKRRRLPGAWLRAIPVLGGVFGAAVCFALTSRIGLGFGLGLVTGWAVYQFAAHRWSEKSAHEAAAAAEIAGDRPA